MKIIGKKNRREKGWKTKGKRKQFVLGNMRMQVKGDKAHQMKVGNPS